MGWEMSRMPLTAALSSHCAMRFLLGSLASSERHGDMYQITANRAGIAVLTDATDYLKPPRLLHFTPMQNPWDLRWCIIPFFINGWNETIEIYWNIYTPKCRKMYYVVHLKSSYLKLNCFILQINGKDVFRHFIFIFINTFLALYGLIILFVLSILYSQKYFPSYYL